MTDRMLVGHALAPAKINLGLEITGRRSDGFHDILTVIQTVSIFDRIKMTAPGSGNVITQGALVNSADNLITRAARLMAGAFVRPLEFDFEVHKRIPMAAGLGGGSSDAASAIRLLAGYWRIPIDDPRLVVIANDTGSDVAFFLTGGRALVTGRGDRIQPLPPLKPFWAVIVVPDVTIARKTATLFGALRDDDFTDGTRLQAESQQTGSPAGWLPNAFVRPVSEMLSGVRDLRAALDQPGAIAHGLSGAGPAHYMLTRDLATATEIASELRSLEFLQRNIVRIARTTTGPGPSIIRQERLD